MKISLIIQTTTEHHQPQLTVFDLGIALGNIGRSLAQAFDFRPHEHDIRPPPSVLAPTVAFPLTFRWCPVGEMHRDYLGTVLL